MIIVIITIIMMIITNNNDNKVPFWSAIAGMVEEVEHPIPTKYPFSQAQNMSNSWSSRGGTAWNKQENEQKAKSWRLQTG